MPETGPGAGPHRLQMDLYGPFSQQPIFYRIEWQEQVLLMTLTKHLYSFSVAEAEP